MRHLFEKRNNRKQTWQHSKSKKWHCIDYVIMKKVYRRKYLGVSVMQGADCNTDHRMLRVKAVEGRKVYFRKKCTGAGVKRWDVAKLQCTSRDARERERW